MNFRHQPPAYSPVTAGSLLAGLRGVLGDSSVEELRGRLQSHLSSATAILTNSGTSALMLAIRAVLNRRRGLIALPAYACYDLATAAVGADADVVFYDIDPQTLTPDLDSLEDVLRLEPAALVIVHLFGIPVDSEPILRMAARSGTVVIEDAAQAIGAMVNNRPAGSFGSLAVLSFSRGKGLTGGSGGALLGNDPAGAELLSSLELPSAASGWKDLGSAALQSFFARPLVYGIPAAFPILRLGETVYRTPQPARAMSRAAATIVNAVWDISHAATAGRQINAVRLSSAARATSGWYVPPWPSNCSPGFLRLPIRPKGKGRAVQVTQRARQLGVMRSYPSPLQRLPALQGRQPHHNDQELKGATELADSLITLPTHTLLSETDLVGLERWLASLHTA